MIYDLKDRVWINGIPLRERAPYPGKYFVIYNNKEEHEELPTMSIVTDSNVEIVGADMVMLDYETGTIEFFVKECEEAVLIINTNEMFVNIETPVSDTDIAVSFHFVKVPYHTFARAILENETYPISWVYEAKCNLTNVNEIMPPSDVLRIKMSPTTFPGAFSVGTRSEIVQSSHNLIMAHIDDWHKSRTGICVGAVVPIDKGTSTASGIFRGSMTDVEMYMITAMSKDCPAMAGKVTLSAFNEENENLELTFDEFIYRYRGVWSVNCVVIDDNGVHVCMNGIRIKKKLTKKLQGLIDKLSDVIADRDNNGLGRLNFKSISKGMPTYDIADKIYDLLILKYTSGKMSDEVLILQKNFIYNIPVRNKEDKNGMA